MPELLQPYKYENINKNDLEMASEIIVEKILQQKGTDAKLSGFINRTKELGEIEESIRSGYKFIILNGILGIGKYSLAEKAISWLYPNRVMLRIVIDFNTIPGIAELAIELLYKTKKKLINKNSSIDDQKQNIQYSLEYISAGNIVLILKDVKKWLNEDGTMCDNLLFITDFIIQDMFSYPVIMTSSALCRYRHCADDCIIFCKSRKSAERTLENIVPYITGKLFLKVNLQKTTVSQINKIKYLGYGFYRQKGNAE